MDTTLKTKQRYLGDVLLEASQRAVESDPHCALELYDSGNFYPFLCSWWRHMQVPYCARCLETARDWCHGAMIAIPSSNHEAVMELHFLVELLDCQEDILK